VPWLGFLLDAVPIFLCGEKVEVVSWARWRKRGGGGGENKLSHAFFPSPMGHQLFGGLVWTGEDEQQIMFVGGGRKKIFNLNNDVISLVWGAKCGLIT
jgi:hypothetical protein